MVTSKIEEPVKLGSMGSDDLQKSGLVRRTSTYSKHTATLTPEQLAAMRTQQQQDGPQIPQNLSEIRQRQEAAVQAEQNTLVWAERFKLIMP